MRSLAHEISPLPHDVLGDPLRSSVGNPLRFPADPSTEVRVTAPSERSAARSRGRSSSTPARSTAARRSRTVGTLDVHLDSWLREFGPRGSEQMAAGSVSELIDVLEGKYPRLRFKIRDETGQLRRYVRVFVDGEDVSGTTGVATSLEGARSIDILHSIAGG